MVEISKISMIRFSASILLLLFSASPVTSLTTDGLSLLALKSAISLDPTHALVTWLDSDSDPCAWLGVTCRRGRVTALSLSNHSLHGYLPSELSLLSSLQTLTLPRNYLSGPIPAGIFTLQTLTSLDLSHNSLSGPIPAEIATRETLVHLDLSSNLLNGTLPSAIAALPNLSGVLNLSCNLLTGRIPAEFGHLPVTVSLDLRRNNLSGEIPQVGSLLNQGPTAFAGNPSLCGFPLKTQCSTSKQDPRVPKLNPNPNPNPNPDLYPSSPSLRPVEEEKQRKPAVTVPILSGIVVAAVVSVLVLQWQLRRKREGKEGNGKRETEERRETRSGEVYVAVDEGFGMELEELLRASAYVVGKSRSGIVYKVVVGRGAAVAVRRLSEAEEGEEGEGEWRRRRGFESEAMAIGRVKHPNVVSLRAYYYAPDEKLLIYDYIPNGTLHAALHGGALNPAAAPLPWAVRLTIVQGAAQGLAFLHECSPRKYIHGNIKTSKILLDDDLQPYISGFGLTQLIAGTHKFSHSTSKKLNSTHLVASGITSRSPNSPSASYLAPEARAPGNCVTQKSDVYAFGIVLLEVLTGRSPEARPEYDDLELEAFVRRAFKEERPLSEVVDPSLLHEVHAKKQVLSVFHVALGCTELDPEMRPRMRAVSESLDRIGAPN